MTDSSKKSMNEELEKYVLKMKNDVDENNLVEKTKMLDYIEKLDTVLRESKTDEEKEKETILKDKQAKETIRNGRIKLVLDGVTGVGSLGLLGWLTYRGFKFEETGTIRSTFFKNVFNKIRLPKNH